MAAEKAHADREVLDLEPALHAFARRAVGDRDLARDLVQETLLAVVAGRAGYQGRASLRTWAIGILTHKVVDHFRTRDRLAPPDESAVDALAEPSGDVRPDRVLARREALSIIERTLGELPALERLAVLLIDVEGQDRADACRSLALTANHLRVLLHRGRHRLRRALERAGVTDGI